MTLPSAAAFAHPAGTEITKSMFPSVTSAGLTGWDLARARHPTPTSSPSGMVDRQRPTSILAAGSEALLPLAAGIPEGSFFELELVRRTSFALPMESTSVPM